MWKRSESGDDSIFESTFFSTKNYLTQEKKNSIFFQQFFSKDKKIFEPFK